MKPGESEQLGEFIMPIQRTLGPALLLLLVLLLVIIQSLTLLNIVGAYANYIYTVIAYVSIAGLLWIERDHLVDFRLDRFTLVLLVLSSVLRSRLGVGGEGFFLLVIGLSGLAITILLLRHRPTLLKSSPRWLLIAVVVGGLASVPATVLEASRFQAGATGITIPVRLVPPLMRQIVYQLSFTVLIEELVFRGFLWGYLQRLGVQESRAMWAQGILFWLLHFPQIGSLTHFFVVVPLGALIYTGLTRKSGQLGPAALAHTVINTIAPVVLLVARIFYA